MDRNARIFWALVAAAVVLAWVAVLAPLRADVRQLRASLPELERQYSDMVGLYNSYQRFYVDEQTLAEWVRNRPADFGLFAHVTEVAQRQNLVLASLRPSARPLADRWQVERVKVELDDVSLPALIGFLYALTAPHNLVHLDAFELRGSGSRLEVTFEAQTLTLRE